jgi:hypothetical protein
MGDEIAVGKFLGEVEIASSKKHELEVRQTEALASIGNALQEISKFITAGGLAELLSGYARSQSVKDILGGLAAHDGRNALDARVLGQNAIEIVEQVEKVFDKYQERLSEKGRDPEIKDAENDFNKWRKVAEDK